MGFKKIQEDFLVETLRYGEKDAIGDKIYEFRILSKKPMIEVKKICKETLLKSFEKKNRANPFSLELLEFKKVTNLDNGMGEMYVYRVKKPNTS